MARKKPSDLKDGISKYEEFHDLPHKRIGSFQGLKIPRHVTEVGEMEWVAYRSSKWNKNGKKENYIHDHEGGVMCHRLDAKAEGDKVEVPAWIQETETLVRLGECLGLQYTDHDGDKVEGATARTKPELYCTPDGKALFVIERKSKIIAIIWGGFLGVESRGIVN